MTSQVFNHDRAVGESDRRDTPRVEGHQGAQTRYHGGRVSDVVDVRQRRRRGPGTFVPRVLVALQERYDVTARPDFREEVRLRNGVGRRVEGAVIHQHQRAVCDGLARGYFDDEKPMQAANRQVDPVLAGGEMIEGRRSRLCRNVTLRTLRNRRSTRGQTYGNWPRNNRERNRRGDELSTQCSLLPWTRYLGTFDVSSSPAPANQVSC